MTYCVGLRLNRGLVFMSDTRTNAGVDNFSMTRKMFTWEVPDDRLVTILTSGNLATTQAGFAAVFAGVAHQASAAGQTDDISVDISPLSVYEFDCHPAACEVGDRFAPDELSSTLMNHQLEAVGGSTPGIARAVEYRPASSTTVRVTFASALHTAAAGAPATS